MAYPITLIVISALTVGLSKQIKHAVEYEYEWRGIGPFNVFDNIQTIINLSSLSNV